MWSRFQIRAVYVKCHGGVMIGMHMLPAQPVDRSEGCWHYCCQHICIAYVLQLGGQPAMQPACLPACLQADTSHTAAGAVFLQALPRLEAALVTDKAVQRSAAPTHCFCILACILYLLPGLCKLLINRVNLQPRQDGHKVSAGTASSLFSSNCAVVLWEHGNTAPAAELEAPRQQQQQVLMVPTSSV
jgi:hypothetical protein